MGAMATLIDTIGAVAVLSLIGLINISVQLNISYYSTPKIQVRSLTFLHLIFNF